MVLDQATNKIDLERVILVPLFSLLILIHGFGTYTHLKDYSSAGLIFGLQLIYQLLVICFYVLIVVLFFRRSQARATSNILAARILAYAGAFIPFMLIFSRRHQVEITPALFSISIMTIGMCFALYSLKTLGRSFGIMPQARILVRSGPYRLIRHPLYVGEIVCFGGAILAGFTIGKLAVFFLLIIIQSYRAIQEEKILEETLEEYREYKASTKRFIPRLL